MSDAPASNIVVFSPSGGSSRAFDQEHVTCLLCGETGWKRLSRHLSRVHGITTADYIRRFPGGVLQPDGKVAKRERPSFADPVVMATICRAVRLGATYEIAANVAGVSYGAMHSWLLRGEEEERGVYHDFFVEFKQAEAEGAIDSLKQIDAAAASGAWSAAAWRLERRFPKDYGRAPITQDGSGTFLEQAIRLLGERKSIHDRPRLREPEDEDPEDVE